MNLEKDKLMDAVIKLIALTQEGKIEWVAKKPRASLNKEDNIVVETIYTTTYDGKTLGLYEQNRKIQTLQSSALSYILATPQIAPYWEKNVILEIQDNEGEELWKFQSISPLKDLLVAVKYKIAGVSDLLDALLNENENQNE